ncbi:hypothetical protein H2200_000187 [Cladophialophora chaetospira]|uniref:Uncharacterized protein n=1 Tax=Cladophialophora chaetospira TaxID=386627 RepID=A0AA38XMX9_9EURO|nr:hypothetical protein H2200_000187 [Cladophialophora chaetospira]
MEGSNHDGHHLLDLPGEVLNILVTKLSEEVRWNGAALSSFRQTCKRACRAADFAWCRQLRITHASQWWKLDRIFRANKQCIFHVQALMINSTYLDSIQEGRFLLRSISRFPNLTYLKLDTWSLGDSGQSLEPLLADLNRELWTNGLAELREADLQLGWSFETLWKPYEIVNLMKAPKLKRLALDTVNLVGFRGEDIPERSTALKHLKLSCCATDEKSLSELLSKPLSLRSLHVCSIRRTSNRLPRALGDWNLRQEIDGIRLLVPLVAQIQPGLTSMSVKFVHIVLPQDTTNEELLDYSQLVSLKKLRIAMPLVSEGGMVSENTSFPANAFDNLPVNIECIELESPRSHGAIDLNQLADALSGKPLPGSLSQLHVHTVEEHCRPFNKECQDKDDVLHRGIDRLMRELSIKRLTYTQRHPHSFEELRYDIAVPYEMFRMLTANKKSTAEDSEAFSEDGRPYELEEMTWKNELRCEGEDWPCENEQW